MRHDIPCRGISQHDQSAVEGRLSRCAKVKDESVAYLQQFKRPRVLGRTPASLPRSTPADDPESPARLTGVLYLLIIVLGLFAELVVRSTIRVPGNPAITALAIQEDLLLVQAGFVADILIFLADVVVAALLYVLLRPAGKVLALTAAALRLTGTAIYGANLLHMLAAYLLAGGEMAWMSALTEPHLNELALFFLELHGYGYDLGLVFFGLHCALLGPLLWRSAAFPSVLGVLMVLAGVGYWVGSFTHFLAPDALGLVEPVYVLPLVGELAFTGWLLLRGVRDESAPTERTA